MTGSVRFQVESPRYCLHPYIWRAPQRRLQFVAKEHWPLAQDFHASAPKPLQLLDDFAQFRLLARAARIVLYCGWDGTACMVATAGDVLTLHASPNLSHLVLHLPGAPPHFCLEPMSHGADAFNLTWQGAKGTGACVLASGESLKGWVSFVSTSIYTE